MHQRHSSQIAVQSNLKASLYLHRVNREATDQALLWARYLFIGSDEKAVRLWEVKAWAHRPFAVLYSSKVLDFEALGYEVLAAQ